MQDMKKSSGPITIYDVAREAGVSDATVSRVFNNKKNVRATTRQKVLEAAEKLDYVANLQARILAGGKSNIIGLLVPGLDTAYMGEIVRGIDHELANAGYEMILYTTRRRGANEASYLQYIANSISEGLLLVVPLLSPKYLEALTNLQYPYVLIDERDVTGNSFSIDTTNRQGAYEATEYLIQIGHRKIAFINGIAELHSSIARLGGYKTALTDYDILINPDYIADGNFIQHSGHALATGLLELPDPPTAIFAANDIMALGVMDAVREKGLDIPGDISVIGFDDIPQASTTHPKLTTIQQPLEAMGRAGVQLLLEQIENPESPPESVTLPTKFIIRDSCRPIDNA